MNVEMWFPVAIYREDNLIPSVTNEKLKKHCLDIKNTKPSGGEDWLGGTYNTHGTHDLRKDPEIMPLLDLITSHVNDFAKMHNCNATYKNGSAWLNVAGPTAWQEFHTHNSSIFSAVYYVAAPEGSGKIIFEDPKEPDMFPLKNVKGKNALSYTRISYPATEGMLLIFRSYLRHMVEPGVNTDPRISIAMNFI